MGLKSELLYKIGLHIGRCKSIPELRARLPQLNKQYIGIAGLMEILEDLDLYGAVKCLSNNDVPSSQKYTPKCLLSWDEIDDLWRSGSTYGMIATMERAGGVSRQYINAQHLRGKIYPKKSAQTLIKAL